MKINFQLVKIAISPSISPNLHMQCHLMFELRQSQTITPVKHPSSYNIDCHQVPCKEFGHAFRRRFFREQTHLPPHQLMHFQFASWSRWSSWSSWFVFGWGLVVICFFIWFIVIFGYDLSTLYIVLYQVSIMTRRIRCFILFFFQTQWTFTYLVLHTANHLTPIRTHKLVS